MICIFCTSWTLYEYRRKFSPSMRWKDIQDMPNWSEHLQIHVPGSCSTETHTHSFANGLYVVFHITTSHLRRHICLKRWINQQHMKSFGAFLIWRCQRIFLFSDSAGLILMQNTNMCIFFFFFYSLVNCSSRNVRVVIKFSTTKRIKIMDLTLWYFKYQSNFWNSLYVLDCIETRRPTYRTLYSLKLH